MQVRAELITVQVHQLATAKSLQGHSSIVSQRLFRRGLHIELLDLLYCIGNAEVGNVCVIRIKVAVVSDSGLDLLWAEGDGGDLVVTVTLVTLKDQAVVAQVLRSLYQGTVI